MCGKNETFQADSVLTIQKIVLQRGETETHGHLLVVLTVHRGLLRTTRSARDSAIRSRSCHKSKVPSETLKLPDTQTRRTIDPGSSCHRADLHQHDATPDFWIKNCHETESKYKVVGLTESRTLLVLVPC
jgi:hypothetical protein